MPSYKVKSKTSMQEKELAKKKWSSASQSLLEKERGPALENQLATLRLGIINYKKLFLILKKNAIRSKISSFTRKETNFPLASVKQNYEASLRQLVSKLSFTRI